MKLFFKDYYYFGASDPQVITKDFQGDPTHPLSRPSFIRRCMAPSTSRRATPQPNTVYYTKFGDVTVRKL